jgi:peptidoglycan hydrolase CwlO-like protein
MEMLTPILIALIGAGGLWKFLELRARQAHETLLADKEERGEFNDTLRAQVDRLAEKLDIVTAENQNLLREMAELKSQLAAAQTTIQHLQMALQNR